MFEKDKEQTKTLAFAGEISKIQGNGQKLLRKVSPKVSPIWGNAKKVTKIKTLYLVFYF